MVWTPDLRRCTPDDIREAAASWRAFAAEMEVAAITETRRGDAVAASTRKHRAAEARQIADDLLAGLPRAALAQQGEG